MNLLRSQIFFSYSHKDRKWLDACQNHLTPLFRKQRITIWSDTQIKSGDLWRNEIEKGLAAAKVAVLLVSPDFLNSDFIAENELPPLLEASEKEGLRILWVAVRYSSYEDTDVARYKAVNDPLRPLASLRGSSREKELVRICKEIKSAASETLPTTSAIRPDTTEFAESPIEDLITLRKLTVRNGLKEHVSDSSTVRVWHYPSAVSVSRFGPAPKEAEELSIAGNQDISLIFNAPVYAFGFYYQQGINPASFRVSLANERTFSYYGKEFFPNMSFLGFYSQQPIQRVKIATDSRGGSFVLRSFYFYASDAHERDLAYHKILRVLRPGMP